MLLNRDRAQKVLAERDVGGLVATTAHNVNYVTGIQSVGLRLFGTASAQVYALVAADALDAPHLVVPVGEADQALGAITPLGCVHPYGSFFREEREGVELTELESRLKALAVDTPRTEGPVAALAAAIEASGLTASRVAVDEEGLGAANREKLAQRFPELVIVPGSALFRHIRKVKTAEEIRRLRRATQICETAIQASVALAKAGTTEREIAREVERTIASLGGRPVITLLRFGRNAPMGQLPPDTTALRTGDTVWFDVVCTYEGYYADIARTFVCGEPSARVRDWYRAMVVGEDEGAEILRPGVAAKDVFHRAVSAVREAGPSHYRRTHVGHAIGLEVYEPPLLAAHVDDVVEAGMVINIETPYFEIGFGALHVEDPYLVGESGVEILTRTPRDLGIIFP